MKNRGEIVLLAVVLAVICLFDLSFSWKSQEIEAAADQYAMDDKGNVNYFKKQDYKDSLWNEEVYFNYTLKEVKEKELALGLDLQGGMHVILEVSPAEIVKSLAGSSVDATFEEALKAAELAQRESQETFAALFFDALVEAKDGANVAYYFAKSSNKDRLSYNTANGEVEKYIEEEVADAVDRAYEIVRTRIDQFGVTQPNVQKIQGTSRIQIELPGVDNPERVRGLLQGVAKLEFYEVWDENEAAPVLAQLNSIWVEKNKTAEEEVATPAEEESLFEGDSAATDSAKVEETVVSPLYKMQARGFFYALEDTAAINDMLRDADVKAATPAKLMFAWDNQPTNFSQGTDAMYLIKLNLLRKEREPKLSGEVISDARQSYDQNGRPSISMSMDVTGARKWKKLTADNIGRPIAIVLDNRVYSAPTVQVEIANGNSEISGNFSVDEAKDLANILKAGKLPAPTRIVEEVVVGPSLGKVAQGQGVTSVVVGIVLVILFMIVYYGKGGGTAVAALVANVFFIFGVLANLGAALTLPGIAGIVLTIGMSIDANVLIFERIREERRNGLLLLDAIKTGYQKAFWTIFDANLTTLLTALMLFVFGTGPIKGFAITLIWGIIFSFFTAVFLTREIIVAIVKKKGNDSSFSFETALSSKMTGGSTFDFIGKRKIAYGISAVMIIVGLGALFTNNLKFGVDFKGGRSYVVEFAKDVVPSKLEADLVKTLETADVKTYGSDNVLKITTAYLVDEESAEADAEVLAKVKEVVASHTGTSFATDDAASEGTFIIASSSKVGATIADDIKKNAWEAVGFSILVIFAYIWLRFRKAQFGLGAIIALIHDTLIVLSAFAIATMLGVSLEVDQVFVAAILTIVGYSINDTVVVFDHVRERFRENAGISAKETFNQAINNTLNRTVITSITTLLVIIILLVFGGEVLRGFSFSMLVGILIGTYSSIFIASPIVYDTTPKTEKETAEIV
ncbi:protein translocase subunit SecDF [Algivirga pacifica]|uniref:Multifunctional fusion protein n=1 Tax=Algivirga pacifica TaxID=1162670 RepID=A0ABP9D3H7_9BACT